MSKITLYTNPWSRGRAVRWMLEELGAHYEVVVKEYGGSIKSPEYLAINPMGKVPALVHGDTVITEVSAICAYLADAFPASGLAPSLDSPLRGTYQRWMYFLAGPLEMAATAATYDWQINAENSEAVGCGLIPDSINALEMALSGSPYLCGDQFTAADIIAASKLGWFMQQKVVEDKPAFVDYVARLQQRPAAIRANQLDDALVKDAQPMMEGN